MLIFNSFAAAILLFVSHFFPAISAMAAHHPAPRQYTTSSLNVGNGITLAYLDSGAPSAKTYNTIIAIHGMGFYSRKPAALYHNRTAWLTYHVAV